MNGFKGIIRHPVSIVPALIASAVITALFIFAIGPEIANLVLETIFLGNVPETGISVVPFQFLSLYSGSLLVLALGAVVALLIGIATNFFYANFAKELQAKNPSIGKAFSKTISDLPGIIAVAIFGIIIAVILGIAFWVLLLVAGTIAVVSEVIMAIIAILAAYCVVKIAFLVPIMATEKAKLKEALGKSWEFTNKKFWTVLVFSIINQIIFGIGLALSDAVIDTNIGIIVYAVFWAMATAFMAIAIAIYYIETE